MALADREYIEALLCCPRCKVRVLFSGEGPYCTSPSCPMFGTPRLSVCGQPVLIDFADSVVSPDDVLAWSSDQQSHGSRLRYLSRSLSRMTRGENQVAANNADRLLRFLHSTDDRALLVVGGGTIGSGADQLYRDPVISIVAFDVFASPLTQFVADAHHIPLPDEAVDAVWVQAVLEHVLDPTRVVDEIHRVLRPGGWAYIETPFLQQVHEGPYDFYRFTLSGHRWLLKHFEPIDRGAVGGPYTQLLWSIDHSVRALTRSRVMGAIVRAGLGWLRIFDRACDSRFALDAAAGTYFLGYKSGAWLSPAQVVAEYQGAQRRPRRWHRPQPLP